MARPTVFVVDDNTSVRTGLRRLLASLRYPIRAFASAEQFLSGADRNAPGCLISDVRLPGMSGVELQQKMAEQGWTLPIIFITSQDDSATRETALRRGATDYLSKPFDCDRLLASVRRALGTEGADGDGPPDGGADSPPTVRKT